MSCACPTCGAVIASDDGRVLFDASIGVVVANGHIAQLTRAESAVFEALHSAGGRVLSKDAILARTHRDLAGDDERDVKIVDVFVCKARKKLLPLGVEIQTVWGQGYRLNIKKGVSA